MLKIFTVDVVFSEKYADGMSPDDIKRIADEFAEALEDAASQFMVDNEVEAIVSIDYSR